ncbi:putative bifunctional diguanylate cyclase/phosphodiesterase [Allosphingosinicella indica]|uniref:Diguanylate cyclase (GGDEF) domain-containing protein n=1 Tax=Allosphingosinicella indica TaxID=941907 RepID=A0A1X7H361_9SPHN|nr:bifunctional diguanylate cyclase/phosphodiesterase [Allosphingosinicella indica]SMF78760.1 diguanylate cyclase (GGDEF) domain-containing protein [Allosphingosinicella indica]
MSVGGSQPIFILSFRHRDELTRTVEAAGWQPIAARRAANAEARFAASSAGVAIVDARGALAEGLDAVRALADAAEANAAALIVLVSRTDAEALDRVHAAGATHFLVSPFSDLQLLQTVRFAQRHADRVTGGYRAPRRSGDAGPPVSSWRWEPGSRAVELSPALARRVGLGETAGARISLLDLFRKLDADGRRAARGAVERTIASGRATAFAHSAIDEAPERLIHHLRIGEGGSVIARTETLFPDDAPAQSRDAMTGVRDARAGRAWIDQQLAVEGTSGLVLILVAVSRFDAINAAFGRAVGDAVLQAAARRIERLVDADGSQRLVARVAGAEFMVAIAPPTGLAEGGFIAAQLVEALGRPFMSGDHVVTLGCRVGVVAAEPGDDAASLLRKGSAALAEAKSEGGPIRVIEGGAEVASGLDDRLEVDLRRALDQDEIRILFQPQISVATGRVIGAEALARWQHPELGELGAMTLFNVAERSDYLVQLSDHVQRKAVAVAAAWPENLRGLRLAVNVTAQDMKRPGFAAQFLDLVEDSGFAAERLTVEVTETGLIEDLNGAASLLAELREGGLRVAIDDFGTGYSSLAYLKALPLDYLKIDRRLSEDIVGSPRDRIVVRSVIEMARSLGLDVVAEGVETEEQLELLAREGCNVYQGFLCAPPVTVDTLAALVAERA